jgi:hypothetical protein
VGDNDAGTDDEIGGGGDTSVVHVVKMGLRGGRAALVTEGEDVWLAGSD